MTKRKWREELKRRAIEAQRLEIDAHRLGEIAELDRRRLVGIKCMPAIGNGTNHPEAGTVRTVFVAGGAVSSRASLNLNKCEFNHAKG